MSAIPRAALATLLVAVAAPAEPAGSHADDLVRLAAIPAPSGGEEELVAAVAGLLAPGRTDRERFPANLYYPGGAASAERLVVAPLDEPGWVVSAVGEDGWVRLQATAREPHRLDPQWLLGSLVAIGRSGARLPGAVAAPSTHLRRGGSEPAGPASLSEIWVDVGAATRSEALAAGAEPAEPVARRWRVSRTASGRLAGPGLAARALTYAALLAARAAGPAPAGTAFAFVAQALPGRRGEDVAHTRFAAPRRVYLLRSDFGLARTAAGTLERAGDHALGSGVLAAGLDERERSALQRAGIRFADAAPPELRPTAYTKGPAWPAGAPAAFGIPVRYASTPVEMVDPGDAVELARALAVLLGADPETIAPLGIGAESPAPAPQPDTVRGWLERLVLAPGPAGAEAPVREAVAAGLPSTTTPEVDAEGNLVLRLEPSGAEAAARAALLFVAHLDEIGFRVNGFDERGRARLEPLGGFYASHFEARPAVAWTDSGPLAGVLAPRDGDLEPGAREPRPQELRLDLGGQALTLGLAPGDRVTVVKELVALGPHRLAARSLDDRVGSTALLLAARRIDRRRLDRPVILAWSVREEIGLDGALALARRLTPEVVFAVDTFVAADSPLEEPRLGDARLGLGPVVRAADHSNLAPLALVRRVREIAREARLPLQVGVTGGGNDGAVFAARGVPDVPLAWPLRSSHTAAEVADVRDVEGLAALVQAVAERW